MPAVRFSSVTIFLLLAAAVAESRAIEINPKHHVWGRYPVGAWRRVRVRRETFAAEGKRVEIVEVTTRLVRVETDGVVLDRETRRGDNVEREQRIELHWDGSPKAMPAVEKYGLGEVDVEGKTYTCQTHRLTLKGDQGDTLVKAWYCPDHPPYYVKRLVQVRGERPRTSSMRVLRRDVKQMALGKQWSCWESETLRSAPNRKTTERSFHSLKIPGGLLKSQAETVGGQQGVAQREQVELIAFGLKGDQ